MSTRWMCPRTQKDLSALLRDRKAFAYTPIGRGTYIAITHSEILPVGCLWLIDLFRLFGWVADHNVVMVRRPI